MKTIFRLFVVLGFMLAIPGFKTSGQSSISSDGSLADPSAMLDVKSTARGMLLPRMTASQRTGISSPANGLIVYQTDGVAGFYYFNVTVWTYLGSADHYSGNVIDMDGNAYPTVKIGNQEWMAKNLNVTHYRNGDSIPYVPAPGNWSGLSKGAYCYYVNEPAYYSAIYGALYNWLAVNDNRNICPSGWHVPTDAEWTTMTSYLGGLSVAGGKMKVALRWNYPNVGALNTSGFSALPGGDRHEEGTFYDESIYSTFWSSTESTSTNAWYYGTEYYDIAAGRSNYNKKAGFSVRCIRN